jgi:hypothetical protein
MHRLARAAYVAASLIVLSGAAPAAGQLDAASQRCIDAYHATLRLVAQETDRWARRCLREGEVGRVADVEACLSGDASGRIARRADQVARLYPGRCDGDEPIQQGAAAGTAAHRAAATGLAGDLLGRPLPVSPELAGAERDCRTRVGRRAGEALAAVLAAHRGCAAAGMRAGTVIDGASLDAQCGTFAQVDGGGGASAALDRLAADAATACDGASLATALPGLDAACLTTPTALADCAGARARCRACAALRDTGGRQLDCDLFDDGTANASCARDAIGARGCRADLEILMLNSALPLVLRPTTDLTLQCGAIEDGRAACECALPEFSPLVIPAIGDVCVVPVAGCPAGVLDCGPGSPLDSRFVPDHNVGTCDGNAQCAEQCEAACGALGPGYASLGSACEGFCQGGSNDGAACGEVSQCPGGACPGRANFGHLSICNCTCADSRRGTPAQGLACSAGVRFDVELPSNGRCGDAVTVRNPPFCLPLTTGESSGRLLHADNMQLAIPYSGGDLTVRGAPLSCEAIAAGPLSGLVLAGNLVLFDTTIGDNLARVTLTCR